MRTAFAASGLAALALAGTAAALPPKALKVAELPKGAPVVDGKTKAWVLVKVVDGKVAGVESANEKTGNVSITFKAISSGTMVTFESKVDVAVKLDLYLSKDNQQFTYTSSCPLTAKHPVFEMWPGPVPFLAVAGGRVVSGDENKCE